MRGPKTRQLSMRTAREVRTHRHSTRAPSGFAWLVHPTAPSPAEQHRTAVSILYLVVQVHERAPTATPVTLGTRTTTTSSMPLLSSAIVAMLLSLDQDLELPS